MPRYLYECTCKQDQFIIDHLSDETITSCPHCGSDKNINKKLVNFETRTRRTSTKNKVGAVTEAFIKEAHQELKQQKQDLEKKT
jgi:predicted nucleic acid-binding Zn ribbon protein